MTISVDLYDGGWIKAYWDDNGECRIDTSKDVIRIVGNKEFMLSFATQMVYFACNDFLLPFGSHIHYDSSFGRRYNGKSLVIEIATANDHQISLDVSNPVTIPIRVPYDKEELYDKWNSAAQVNVFDSNEEVHILGNRQGLLFMASVLFFLAERNKSDSFLLYSEKLCCGWLGKAISFELCNQQQ